jgi:hypothetical protein
MDTKFSTQLLMVALLASSSFSGAALAEEKQSLPQNQDPSREVAQADSVDAQSEKEYRQWLRINKELLRIEKRPRSKNF